MRRGEGRQGKGRINKGNSRSAKGGKGRGMEGWWERMRGEGGGREVAANTCGV